MCVCVCVCVCVCEERERERGALFIVIGGFSFYYCDTNTICNLNKQVKALKNTFFYNCYSIRHGQ